MAKHAGRRVQTKVKQARRQGGRGDKVVVTHERTDAKGRRALWQGASPIFRATSSRIARADARLASKGGPAYLDKRKRGNVEIEDIVL